MTEINPYQTPTASVESPHQKPMNSVWWKVFFWFSAVLMLVGLAVVPFIPGLEIFDYIDLVLSTVANVGLFGFAFYKPIANVVYWRYFFYVVLLWTIIYSMFFPAMQLPRFGEPTKLDGFYLFELTYAALILWAMYAYAYKRPFIWEKSPTD